MTWKQIFKDDEYSYGVDYIINRRMIENTHRGALTRGFITKLEREEEDIVIEFSHIRCLNFATGMWDEAHTDLFKMKLKIDGFVDPCLLYDGRIIFKFLNETNTPDTFEPEKKEVYELKWEFGFILPVDEGLVSLIDTGIPAELFHLK